jgi:pyridoxine 4-dehydrogenase
MSFFAIAGERRASGRKRRRDRPVARGGASPRGTPAQVRLAWTPHQGPNVLVIPGTCNPDHLAENVAAGTLRLTEQDLAVLGSPA